MTHGESWIPYWGALKLIRTTRQRVCGMWLIKILYINPYVV